MKKTLLLCIVLAGPVQAQTTLDQLSWLAGCWRAERGEPGTQEHWMTPAGGAMLGMGRTVRRGATVEHEFMQIRQRGDNLVYIALPSGKTVETVFTLKPGSAAELVFENLAHDFPQRVIYRQAEGGSKLQARIEGERNGQLRGVDFPMLRVSCDKP